VIILYAENAMHRKNGQEEGKKVRFAWWRDTSIWSSILQEDGEAEEDAAEESGQAKTSVRHEDRASGALVATVVAVAGTSLGSTAEARDGDGVCSYAVGASWCRGGRHGGGEGGVASVRFLSTAWVVLAASALAGAVTVAVLNAGVSPLLADEVGQGLGVLRDVWGDTVVTDACVGQSIGVAVVLLGGHGFYAGLLEANERALCPVLVAPVIPCRFRNGVGVDGVWVVQLGGVLSSDQASEGGDAESEDGTHVDGWSGGCWVGGELVGDDEANVLQQ
jgi:hypothetical protein